MEWPVHILSFDRAVRLVAARRLPDPVLLRLVRPPMLDDLDEIVSAASAQRRGESMAAYLFPSGRPHAGFVNAAFAYFRPREPNRFNDAEIGAWYAALAVETSLAEAAFHLGRELARVNDFRASVEYLELWASFSGAFVDLRGIDPRPPCLQPDPAIGYPAGNALARSTRGAGHNGIVYPSVRHSDGTCLVALWPHAVQSVATGQRRRLTWSGSPDPVMEVIGQPL